MAIEIQKLCENHIDGLVKIENGCFSQPWSRKSLENLLTCDYAVYFVAYDEENCETVGYCGMYVSEDTGAINNIGVLTSFRRKGIADMLIRKLVGYSIENGITTLTLEVRRSNTPAIKLYEKNGFLPVGTRKNYYKLPQEDALIYNLDI